MGAVIHHYDRVLANDDTRSTVKLLKTCDACRTLARLAAGGSEMHERASMRKTPAWVPLVMVVAAAIIANIILGRFFNDAWKASELASNLIFGLLLTVATIMINRRQSAIQEALSDSQLAAKIATISGAVDTFAKDFQPSTCQMIFTEARSGLHLIPYADKDAAQEFSEVVSKACASILRGLTSGVRSYTYWEPTDWTRITDDACKLLNSSAKFNGPSCLNDKASEIREILDAITALAPKDSIVPFHIFKRAFHRGDVHERIRAFIDRKSLSSEVEQNKARIVMRRNWSVEWLEENDPQTVWYVNRRGRFSNYFTAGTRRIRVKDINRYFDALPEPTRACIKQVGATFNFRKNGRGLHVAEIVTLEVAESNLLVLDGNHRLSAVMRGSDGHEGPLGVLVVEYRITLDRDVPLVPDLLTLNQRRTFSRIANSLIKKDPTSAQERAWDEYSQRRRTPGLKTGKIILPVEQQ